MSQIPIDDGVYEGGARKADAKASRNPEASDKAQDAPVEEQLRRLETIVQKLESEVVSLDDSIALFEEGVELAVAVRKRLEASEGRIKQIVEKSEGLFSLEDFDLE